MDSEWLMLDSPVMYNPRPMLSTVPAFHNVGRRIAPAAQALDALI